MAAGQSAAASLVLLLSALLAGCAADGTARDWYAAEGLRPGMRVAVLPLANLSGHPDAGLILADMLGTELYRQGSLRLMEESETRRAMRQQGLDADGLGRDAVAAEFAAALGVDAVIVGSVSEYGYQHGLREEPVAGVNVRLVRAGDGVVLWAASHSESGRGYLARESLNAAAQRLVARMVEGLGVALAGGAD